MPSLCPIHLNCATGLESLVLGRCQAQGLAVTHMSVLQRDHPFDLLVNGWRVEVKTVHDTSAAGVFKFFLSSRRKGRSTHPEQVKNYEQDCDFVALVCKPKSGGQPDVFLLTSQECGAYVRIDCRDLRLWASYREAWHRLSAACPQAA